MQLLGGALIAGGIVSVVVAWFGISGTLDPGKQMPYLVSGGLGGALAVAIGVVMLVSDEHARDRDALAELLDRLDALDAMVSGVEAQLVRLEREIVVQGNGAPAVPAKAPGPRATASLPRVAPEVPARARPQGVRVSRGLGSAGAKQRER